MSEQKNEVAEFLEGLPTRDVGRLLNEPIFTGTVLRQAVDSRTVSRAVEQSLDAEFEAMSPQEQSRITTLADRVRSACMP
jgi:hypothetical protein